MSGTDQFQRVMSIFEQACEVPRSERSAFLTRVCGGDTALRREIEGLLEHDDRTEHLSGIETIRGGIRAVASELVRDQHSVMPAGPMPLPSSIGRYRIIRKIGEGGMGTVFEAEQENPRRTVALKVIKSTLASPKMMRRFEWEAQVLGRLTHPGIAQIYEAGSAHSADGGLQAYFAMEFIRGTQFDQYAAKNELSVASRLEILARVADAVQYAHQKGVIHRDLKPANILVVDDELAVATEGESVASAARSRAAVVAQPKILDFGVARTTDPNHDMTTIHTGVGQLIGTLSYMSPEQLTGDPREVDTRSDVYALGVIGHQILTGVLPHDIRSCSIPEAVRRILDNTPARLGVLNRALRGDVEAIIAQALEKDRNRRYQSAADLAADIRRHLAGEPIEVKRDSTLYVFKKNLKRYRGLVAVTSIIMLLLAVFGGVSFFQAQRNRELAQRANEAADRAESARIAAVRSLNIAETERHRADATSEQLRRELTIGNIEQGRLFGRSGNILAAEDALWREFLQAPDFSLAYWALWELYVQHPILAELTFSNVQLACAAYSADGRSIFVGAKDGRIRTIDVESWRTISEIDAHAEGVFWIVVTRDGRRLASVGGDGRVVLRDLQTGDIVFDVETVRTPGAHLTVSPDESQLLVSIRNERYTRILDMATGELVSAFHGQPGNALVAAFSPDARRIAVVGADRSLYIWPNEAGAPLPERRLALGDDGYSICFSSPDRLYIGTRDRIVQEWNIDAGKITRRLSAPNGQINRMTLSRDRRRLITGGYWSIDEWDLETGLRVQSYPMREHSLSLSLSPDESSLLTCGVTGLFVRERQSRGRIDFETSSERAASTISPDGRFAVAGDIDGRLTVWSLADGRLVHDIDAHEGRIHTIEFEKNGPRFITTASGERRAHIWHVETGECLVSFNFRRNQTWASAAWSPDGGIVATGSFDNTIQWSDSRTGQTVLTLPAKGEYLASAFSPDGKLFAATSRGRTVRLWNSLGELIGDWEIDSLRSTWSVAFSPDSTRIALGTWGRTVEIIDVRTLETEMTLEGHSGTVWVARFHPTDSNILFSGAADGVVKLWDLSLQRCVATIDIFDRWDILSIALTADARSLVASSAEGRVAIWDVPYYQRHIAGSAPFHIAGLSPALGDRAQTDRVRAWSANVLAPEHSLFWNTSDR